MRKQLLAVLMTLCLLSIVAQAVETGGSLIAASTAAQKAGKLVGKVVDQDYSPLPDASVEIVRDKSDDRFEGKTDSKGEYRFESIPPGRYTVKVAKKGYKTGTLSDIIVPLNVVTPLTMPPIVLEKKK